MKEQLPKNWIKIALVGDEHVGKTCLVIAYAERKEPGGNEPKVYQAYTTPITVNNKSYMLELRDTIGHDSLTHLEPEIDLIMICFSVIMPTSFDNARLKWFPEIRRLHTGKPIILVGTQVDIREDPTIMNNMKNLGTEPVTQNAAETLAREIGALKYLECSSTHVPAVKKLFDEAVKTCISRVPLKKVKSLSFFASLRRPRTPNKKTSLPVGTELATKPSTNKRKQKARANSTDLLPDTPILVYDTRIPPSPYTQFPLDEGIPPSPYAQSERIPSPYHTPSTGNTSSIRSTSDMYLQSEAEQSPQGRLLPSEWQQRNDSWDDPLPPVVEPPSPAPRGLNLFPAPPTHTNISSTSRNQVNLSSSPPSPFHLSSSPPSGLQMYQIAPTVNGFNFVELYKSTRRELPTLGNPMDWTTYVQKLGDLAIGGGTYGDVYQGGWINLPSCRNNRPPPPLVAIKCIRPLAMYMKDGGKKALRHLSQEIAVWHRLNHDNIVPFIGVSYDAGLFPSLISLWMPNGTLKAYLQTHPNADKHVMNLGVARGLEYLHTQNPEIIHGDLKAVNILVDESEQPRLSDFGLSRIVEEATSSMWITSNAEARGTTRWMAPELLLAQEPKVNRPSDVYAYAMTALEVLTGHVPFHHLNEPRFLMAIVNKERPSKPLDNSISDPMWYLLQECWSETPFLRPTVSELVSRLRRMGQ